MSVNCYPFTWVTINGNDCVDDRFFSFELTIGSLQSHDGICNFDFNRFLIFHGNLLSLRDREVVLFNLIICISQFVALKIVAFEVTLTHLKYFFLKEKGVPHAFTSIRRPLNGL